MKDNWWMIIGADDPNVVGWDLEDNILVEHNKFIID